MSPRLGDTGEGMSIHLSIHWNDFIFGTCSWQSELGNIVIFLILMRLSLMEQNPLFRIRPSFNPVCGGVREHIALSLLFCNA